MRDPSKLLFRNYERYYKEHVADRGHVPYHEVKELHLDRLPRWLDRIPKEARILDAGCATGYLLGLLWESGYHNLIGVELSEQLAAIARRHLPDEIAIVNADVRDYLAQTPDQTFDVILFYHVLEHISREHTIPLLSEFYRSLKPGGTSILEYPMRLIYCRELIYFATSPTWCISTSGRCRRCWKRLVSVSPTSSSSSGRPSCSGPGAIRGALLAPAQPRTLASAWPAAQALVPADRSTSCAKDIHCRA